MEGNLPEVEMISRYYVECWDSENLRWRDDLEPMISAKKLVLTRTHAHPTLEVAIRKYLTVVADCLRMPDMKQGVRIRKVIELVGPTEEILFQHTDCKST